MIILFNMSVFYILIIDSYAIFISMFLFFCWFYVLIIYVFIGVLFFVFVVNAI
ncbi:putative membrane protein [Escherichia coli DEC10F]|nr:putative membrane protein [Escherichia coli DEC10F]